MAFRELQAMQVAYELLSPLDPGAQQRVIAWLSAALADASGAPTAVDESAAPVKPVAHVPADITPRDGVVEVMAEYAAAELDEETAAPTPAVEPVAAAEPEVSAELEPVTEPAPVPVPRSKRGRPAQATGRRAARAAKSATAVKPVEAPLGRRGDRPSGEQYLADLAVAGSFKALAEKYGKSIGTISNWANQLREQGFNIPVGRQKKA
ncbi:hypothetical protein QTQ03_23030 [Micromonospora sp. WMMA1363]|uniref:hypothetical protein n=1 Tax=Micromonospora sp. WMMA1363 TaxID=3053985 RepID=UPI00259CDE30|nr:hypothetical protein [Micromonospora sp. WMMA1363]MDM4722318.1 hypothetical protein [Micromonospora sp. WMMA1363]